MSCEQHFLHVLFAPCSCSVHCLVVLRHECCLCQATAIAAVAFPGPRLAPCLLQPHPCTWIGCACLHAGLLLSYGFVWLLEARGRGGFRLCREGRDRSVLVRKVAMTFCACNLAICFKSFQLAPWTPGGAPVGSGCCGGRGASSGHLVACKQISKSRLARLWSMSGPKQRSTKLKYALWASHFIEPFWHVVLSDVFGHCV